MEGDDDEANHTDDGDDVEGLISNGLGWAGQLWGSEWQAVSCLGRVTTYGQAFSARPVLEYVIAHAKARDKPHEEGREPTAV